MLRAPPFLKALEDSKKFYLIENIVVWNQNSDPPDPPDWELIKWLFDKLKIVEFYEKKDPPSESKLLDWLNMQSKIKFIVEFRR